MKKTLGGDRLGSGNKMQVHLHDYERSTHNLSKVVRTSMSAGVLTPVYRNYALNGDTWDINISHLIKTLPTKGPLMGTMKFQIDFFVCPLRLYVGLLHNNAVKIGMQMDKVYFPQISITDTKAQNRFSGSSLPDYMGVRALQGVTNEVTQTQQFNAIPYLAYYDIFKNYYSNKQEENAFVISNSYGSQKNSFFSALYKNNNTPISTPIELTPAQGSIQVYGIFPDALGQVNNLSKIEITDMVIQATGMQETLTLETGSLYNGQSTEIKINDFVTLRFTARIGISYKTQMTIELLSTDGGTAEISFDDNQPMNLYTESREANGINLLPFPLENIDKMRYNILKQTDLGKPYNISKSNLMPYSTISGTDETNQSLNKGIMNGLCVKTYQSDIYNAWLNSDWIDGKGALGEGKSIQSISSVDVSNGQLTMDALNLAQKIYNMLNRVAASGGTYEDWQEAIYGEEAVRRAESPAYIGGASAEIIFDEVVSTAESGENPQGNLTGKGATTNAQGGHISVKITEPSIIIGIASITPRIDYSQGNWWANIELESMDDLHKPALDGIGFQDLMAYNLAYWANKNQAIGKIPAWMHWMTDVNECFGDFASGGVYDWMVLNRDYTKADNEITDITTYIDPSKYNGIFADANLTAQNYWVQLGFDIKCRRKMSAKLIPNL